MGNQVVIDALDANARGERFQLPVGTVVRGEDWRITHRHDLSNATLEDCAFIDVEFQAVTMRECDFGRSSFQRCNLNGSFDDSSFNRVKFEACQLTGSFCDSDFCFTESYHCEYNRGLFDGSNFHKATIEHADSRVTRFGSFEGCSFVEATISFSNFQAGEFGMCDFTGAVIRNSDFRGAELSRCEFDAFTMYSTNCDHASFLGSRFLGASLRGVNFTGAFLTKTYARNVDLIAAILDDCNLQHADWDNINRGPNG